MQRAVPAPSHSRIIPPKWLLTWALLGIVATIFLMTMSIAAMIVGVLVIYSSGRILPGVSVAGVSLGGLTVEDASAQLESEWSQITVRDGNRIWKVSPAQLGLKLDSGATAAEAQQYGRGDGSLLAALLGSQPMAPVVSVDSTMLGLGIKALAQTVDLPARNATVRVINGGQAIAVPAANGRSLDVQATINKIAAAPDSELADGTFDLVMVTTSPTVTDASGLVDKARALLMSPLKITAYDAVQNQATEWAIPADQWGQWLTTQNSASGVTFVLESGDLTNYLNGQNSALGDPRYIDVAKSISAVQAGIAAGHTNTTVQVLHKPTKYTVKPGDTIGSIAWTHGLPMWRIAKANTGSNIDALNAGQVITLPSFDDMLPLPVVEGKRIVVSISKQHMWVYDHGALKWDWLASTGISDSPTFPGIYQVQSHEKNAYAGNWNLWMPSFMSIYESVPGFWNGIHGFPTRNGQGVIWQGALGSPVTYGCILLSSANAQALYDWAEDGVVIEIQA